MKTKVLKITRVTEVLATELPDGDYEGIRGGYVVKVEIEGCEYRLDTVNGIRTPAASCVVHVDGGLVTID